MSKFLHKVGLTAPLATFALLAPVQTSLVYAVPSPHDHHHPMVAIDGAKIISSGDYKDLTNPNYNRLTLIYPHFHDDITTSHFHGIGSYSYKGSVENPTVEPTNKNNKIPEYWQYLPPNTLLPGEGIFADKLVSKDTGEMYTNWKLKPVKHLEEDLSDPMISYLYNNDNKRWQTSLSEAEIGLKLVSITPGLNVANTEKIDVFSGVGDTYVMGKGDDFSFTPVFYTDKSAPFAKYSATFQLVDVNNKPGHTPLLASGTFTADFQVIPEPSTLLGFGAFSLMMWCRQQQRNKAKK